MWLLAFNCNKFNTYCNLLSVFFVLIFWGCLMVGNLLTVSFSPLLISQEC